jgi:hypothetical protein
MSQLYFHLRDGLKFIRDPDGTRVPSISAARAEARLSARELMGHSIVADGRVGIERCFEVCDGDDRTVLLVPFRDAIDDASALHPNGGRPRDTPSDGCDTEARWKALAAEARSEASAGTDEESQQILLSIALGYERLANFAKVRDDLAS